VGGGSSRGEWIRSRGGKKRRGKGEKEKRKKMKKRKERKGKKDKKKGKKKRQGQFRLFTISSHPVKLFCQTFFKMALTPPEEPELDHFW
jgi:hypothetical protein